MTWITIKEASIRYDITRQRILQLIKGQNQKQNDKEYFIKPKLKENVHWRYYQGEQTGNISQIYEINQSECDKYFGVKNE